MKINTTCSICGKPLSDPISVKIGIGPVCRVHRKTNEMNEKTSNLFSDRSTFAYGFFNNKNILWIEDLGGFKSVTNDIENIMKDIKSEGHDIKNKHIMYKDSYGIWDGIKIENRIVSFFSINETDIYKAADKLIDSKPHAV